jgi:hypothetical protein
VIRVVISVGGSASYIINGNHVAEGVTNIFDGGVIEDFIRNVQEQFNWESCRRKTSVVAAAHQVIFDSTNRTPFAVLSLVDIGFQIARESIDEVLLRVRGCKRGCCLEKPATGQLFVRCIWK